MLVDENRIAVRILEREVRRPRSRLGLLEYRHALRLELVLQLPHVGERGEFVAL